MSLGNAELRDRFSTLTTPVWSPTPVLRLGLRHAPPTARDAPSGLWQTDRWPRPSPVRHLGSVDAFLSTLEGANTGDVLTIDNEGRRDEACIGDLIALEAAAAASPASSCGGSCGTPPSSLQSAYRSTARADAP